MWCFVFAWCFAISFVTGFMVGYMGLEEEVEGIQVSSSGLNSRFMFRCFPQRSRIVFVATQGALKYSDLKFPNHSN